MIFLYSMMSQEIKKTCLPQPVPELIILRIADAGFLETWGNSLPHGPNSHRMSNSPVESTQFSQTFQVF